MAKMTTLDTTTEYERAELCDGIPVMERMLRVKHGYRTLQGDTGLATPGPSPMTGALEKIYMAALPNDRVYVALYARPPRGSKQTGPTSAEIIMGVMGASIDGPRR